MPRGKRRANHDMGEDDRQTSKRQRNTYATATAQNTSRYVVLKLILYRGKIIKVYSDIYYNYLLKVCFVLYC